MASAGVPYQLLQKANEANPAGSRCVPFCGSSSRERVPQTLFAHIRQAMFPALSQSIIDSLKVFLQRWSLINIPAAKDADAVIGELASPVHQIASGAAMGAQPIYNNVQVALTAFLLFNSPLDPSERLGPKDPFDPDKARFDNTKSEDVFTQFKEALKQTVRASPLFAFFMEGQGAALEFPVSSLTADFYDPSVATEQYTKNGETDLVQYFIDTQIQESKDRELWFKQAVDSRGPEKNLQKYFLYRDFCSTGPQYFLNRDNIEGLAENERFEKFNALLKQPGSHNFKKSEFYMAALRSGQRLESFLAAHHYTCLRSLVFTGLFSAVIFFAPMFYDKIAPQAALARVLALAPLGTAVATVNATGLTMFGPRTKYISMIMTLLVNFLQIGFSLYGNYRESTSVIAWGQTGPSIALAIISYAYLRHKLTGIPCHEPLTEDEKKELGQQIKWKSLSNLCGAGVRMLIPLALAWKDEPVQVLAYNIFYSIVFGAIGIQRSLGDVNYAVQATKFGDSHEHRLKVEWTLAALGFAATGAGALIAGIFRDTFVDAINRPTSQNAIEANERARSYWLLALLALILKSIEQLHINRIGNLFKKPQYLPFLACIPQLLAISTCLYASGDATVVCIMLAWMLSSISTVGLSRCYRDFQDRTGQIAPNGIPSYGATASQPIVSINGDNHPELPPRGMTACFSSCYERLWGEALSSDTPRSQKPIDPNILDYS